jgi:hypothetical protein
MDIVVLIVINLLSIVVCLIIAKRRGSRPVFWGVMGGIFGPFAILFALRSRADGR